jgi:hypothetical protein
MPSQPLSRAKPVQDQEVPPMNDTDTPSPYDPEDGQSVRVGYEVAVRLWTYQGSAAWARFSAMLLANSIVAVTVATMVANRAMLCAVPFLPLAGFALCTFWLTIFERGAEYELHYIREARELEGRLPGASVKTVGDGQGLANRKEVTYGKGEPAESHRMAWVAWLRMRHAGRGVIALFFLIHAVMFLGTTALAIKTLCHLLWALAT